MPQAAFPGAEGGGSYSVGGRGGQVLFVTNLNNSGAGSLRAAIEASGPRIVVFRVGGTINLLTELRVNNPYLTVAGQTAPGGGIQLNGQAINTFDSVIDIRTHDVIWRYMRIRKGYNASTPSQGGGGLSILGNSYNVIFDHVSISWGQDENFAVWGTSLPSPKQITLQNSIVSEPFSAHPTNIGYGAEQGTQAGQTYNDAEVAIDVHHCLLANVGHRNPMSGNKEHRLINNIFYNWGFFCIALEGGARVDIVGNDFKLGRTLAADNDHEIEAFPSGFINTASGTMSLYVAGNRGPNHANPDTDNWNDMVQEIAGENDPEIGILSTTYKRLSPISAPYGVPISVDHVTELETLVIPTVGCSQRLDASGNWVSVRDTTDARVVNDYLTTNPRPSPANEGVVGGFPVIAGGTAPTDSNSDGIPDAWATAHGYPVTGTYANDVLVDGYTVIEHYLNGTPLAAPVSLTWLHTDGRFIRNEANEIVHLKGLNWFGMETGDNVVHGLWARNYKDILDQVAAKGFNLLRLPYSNFMLNAGQSVLNVNYTLNPDLSGLGPLQVLDNIIAAAAARGIYVMLDRHRTNFTTIPSLWYDGNISEARWISDWRLLAARYATQPAMALVNLTNEPNAVTWTGNGDGTDMVGAAQRAGNSIHTVNNRLLIVVDGAQTYGDFMNGGTFVFASEQLTRADTVPVVLNTPNRVVYSPHLYPETVGNPNDGRFTAGNYPQNLPAVFEFYWGYLHSQNVAPIIVGEFGGFDVTTRDKQWLRKLTGYLYKKKIGFTFWSLNPNSGDTGGWLTADWFGIEASKESALSTARMDVPPKPSDFFIRDT